MTVVLPGTLTGFQRRGDVLLILIAALAMIVKQQRKAATQCDGTSVRPSYIFTQSDVVL